MLAAINYGHTDTTPSQSEKLLRPLARRGNINICLVLQRQPELGNGSFLILCRFQWESSFGFIKWNKDAAPMGLRSSTFNSPYQDVVPTGLLVYWMVRISSFCRTINRGFLCSSRESPCSSRLRWCWGLHLGWKLLSM